MMEFESDSESDNSCTISVDELYQEVIANNSKPKVRKLNDFNNLNSVVNINDIEVFEFNDITSNNAGALVNENV